jgi:hypothetical protein
MGRIQILEVTWQRWEDGEEIAITCECFEGFRKLR